MSTLVLGFCGGSCSGKTTLARLVQARLTRSRARWFSFDRYYRPLDHLPLSERHGINFDHPDSLDVTLFTEHLAELRAGRGVDAPEYDFATHARLQQPHRVPPAEVVLADGILLLSFPEVRSLLHYSVFLDAAPEVRLERRIARDTVERGRTRASVERQVSQTVEPMHRAWVQPSARFADRVVRAGESPEVVADELMEVIRTRLCGEGP